MFSGLPPRGEPYGVGVSGHLNSWGSSRNPSRQITDPSVSGPNMQAGPACPTQAVSGAQSTGHSGGICGLGGVWVVSPLVVPPPVVVVVVAPPLFPAGGV